MEGNKDSGCFLLLLSALVTIIISTLCASSEPNVTMTNYLPWYVLDWTVRTTYTKHFHQKPNKQLLNLVQWKLPSHKCANLALTLSLNSLSSSIHMDETLRIQTITCPQFIKTRRDGILLGSNICSQQTKLSFTWRKIYLLALKLLFMQYQLSWPCAFSLCHLIYIPSMKSPHWICCLVWLSSGKKIYNNPIMTLLAPTLCLTVQ